MSPPVSAPNGCFPTLPLSLAAGNDKHGKSGLGADGVAQRVQQRLQESSYYFLRRITCVCDRGVVTLRGRVPTYYLKQTVQVLAEKVEGVEQVVNLVDVVEPGEAP